MWYQSKILKCRTSYRGGYIDLNVNDDLRVFYSCDIEDRPVSIWAVKYDNNTGHATYIVFLDKNKSDVSNQSELNKMIACCDGHTRNEGSAAGGVSLVYPAIRILVRNSKRAIMKGMMNE